VGDYDVFYDIISNITINNVKGFVTLNLKILTRLLLVKLAHNYYSIVSLGTLNFYFFGCYWGVSTVLWT
jgi:hypothetical protein